MAKAEIPMTAVKSSAIRGYGYDAPSRVLAVAFKTGRTYRYADVPPSIPEGIASAKSVGRFITTNVVGRFGLAKD